MPLPLPGLYVFLCGSGCCNFGVRGGLTQSAAQRAEVHGVNRQHKDCASALAARAKVFHSTARIILLGQECWGLFSNQGALEGNEPDQLCFSHNNGLPRRLS